MRNENKISPETFAFKTEIYKPKIISFQTLSKNQKGKKKFFELIPSFSRTLASSITPLIYFSDQVHYSYSAVCWPQPFLQVVLHSLTTVVSNLAQWLKRWIVWKKKKNFESLNQFQPPFKMDQSRIWLIRNRANGTASRDHVINRPNY